MVTLLELKDITNSYRYANGKLFKALDSVSLKINAGECVALIGESGSGKSTLARIITGLEKPDFGSVSLNGRNPANLHGKELRLFYSDIKMIFQEPRTSFDPRLRLGQSLIDAIKNQIKDKEECKRKALKNLEMVGLTSHFMKLYPNEVSGGECQRAAIARALSQKPKLLICDEATSALDVSTQSDIISLLKDIQKEENLAILFISHDISLISNFCTRTYMMKKGRITEEGNTKDIVEKLYINTLTL